MGIIPFILLDTTANGNEVDHFNLFSTYQFGKFESAVVYNTGYRLLYLMAQHEFLNLWSIYNLAVNAFNFAAQNNDHSTFFENSLYYQ